MAVITISRELGSEGTIVGRQVAEKLGYSLVDRQTVDAVLRQYGLTRFKDLYTSTPSLWDLLNADNLLIVSMLNETIQALAHRGNTVILGRGGFAVLGEYADVLDVRIQAPFSLRVERVMAREGLTDRQQTEERIRADDNVRRRFVQMFYNERWDLESNFDLVIDTATVSSAMAVDWIIQAAQALDAREVKDGKTTKTIEIDPVLADAINKVLS